METGVKQIKRKDATKEKSKLPKTALEEKESEQKGKR